jgi:hypothetical protein
VIPFPPNATRPHSDWQERLETAGPSLLCALRQQHFAPVPQRVAGVKAPAARGAREAKENSTARLTASLLGYMSEQAIYMVNSFQFTRSARLIPAYRP